jgi:hypothetical protein
MSISPAKVRASQAAAFGRNKRLSLRYSAWGLLQIGCSFAAVGQHLEAVGVAASLNVTQTRAAVAVIPMGYYTLATNTDGSSYDEIGHRLAAYGRWQVDDSPFFVQPELGYTSSQGQMYTIFHYPVSSPLGPDGDTFGHHLRRWEAATLAGLHTGRHTYVLAGPLLTYNQREKLLELNANYPIAAVYNSLYQSVETVQLLAQVGVGIVAGRFDFNLRYEQSLTPYSRRLVYDGTSYGYRQQIRQGLFTAGFLLYKNDKPQPAQEAAY